MVTREETPDTLKSFIKQRTRWNQGFLQVYRKGDWRQLPTRRQRMLARFTLSTPFYQAASGLAVPTGIVIGILVKVPMVIAMASWLPVVPMFLVLAFEMAALRDFGKEYFGKSSPSRRTSRLRYLREARRRHAVLPDHPDVRGAPGGLAGAARPKDWELTSTSAPTWSPPRRPRPPASV